MARISCFLIDTGKSEWLALYDNTTAYRADKLNFPIYSSDKKLGIEYWEQYQILSLSMTDIDIFKLFLGDFEDVG